jgi:transcriptional regulator with XRE-family HTH domain/predicted Fe-Mo cluster-binding NifX family protein
MDDSIPITTEELVGRRLRAIRLNNGLSLKALSEHSGLNINTLSLIENGKTSPSVSTLQQLSLAMGISISNFFESKPELKSIVFTPASTRPQAHIGGTMMENLAVNLKDNALQPFIVNTESGTGSGDFPIVHTGHEFVYCLVGIIQYQINEEIYILHPGDSLVFQAHYPHSWKNIHKNVAQILLVFSPADREEEPGGRHFSLEIQKREINMKIAVISDDGKNISQHFGRAPFYIVFTVEEGKVTNREVREKLGHNQFGGGHHEHEHAHEHGLDDTSHGKHASMADAISDCEALICGGMGMGAYESMKRLNIKPFVTDSLDPESAVQSYVDGKLVDHIEKLH